MKPKISPEDYREILSSLELKTLFLKEINSEFKEELLSQALILDLKEKSSFTQIGRNVNIIFKYQLKAKDADKEAAAITVNATYIVQYGQDKDIQITNEFMKVFEEMTLGNLLWPYFRELTSNMIYRMNLPPLVLPLRKRL